MRNQGAFYYYYLFLDEPRIRNGGDKNALLYSYCKNYVWTLKKKKIFQLCLDFLPSEENVSASSINNIIPSKTDEKSH